MPQNFLLLEKNSTKYTLKILWCIVTDIMIISHLKPVNVKLLKFAVVRMLLHTYTRKTL